MSRRIVLVTGGAGFIGSNIVARLCEDPALDVVVCDRLRDAASGKWRNIAKHPIADFVAPEQLFDWLARRGAEVELIVHMGAVSSTTEADADKIVQSNFVLSRDLWDWCAQHGKRLIYASSAATYGDGSLGFEGKDDLASLQALRPLNAYGWSKALFDIYAVREAHRGHAPTQWAGLKFFNVYGPNEEHKDGMKSVVAQIWPRVAAGEGVRLFKSHHPDYEDGGQLRDFVYVRDAVDVIAWLARNPTVNGVFNLGSGHARSFRDLAVATFEAVNRAPDITYIDMPEVLRGKYQYYTKADMSRLRAAGYDAPMTSLEDGVADYVAGYLNTDDPYR
ncbi:ADP-glyceromanno-heptose 6-epimerase [Caulobacter sp. 602-1]|uniref:ADP-glyceromanno-heptose 6-epimerase n=1 Tax=Caulobacter sp. 602-1 TaxID=2492472 RepID=UPI000F636EB8|nr:ADP-glyceromanno-heptose 6-epimerase [Caulobacter sp. 602-1]RRN62972.1 ADP-glyceromanno-heptose 6-epimerase [Caulobacter sp. 602-1]